MSRPPSAPVAPPLRDAYARLRAQFGHQGWWPAETPFEVCVGAILVQNTAWTNAERALANLRRAGRLEPAALHALAGPALAELLRPAGTFRVKAQRLRAFLHRLFDQHGGSLARLFAGPADTVRVRLLALPGIGPETADCLLLYAGGHPSFVVDAYTRRVFARHGWAAERTGYAELQGLCAANLADPDPAARLDLWQDFHAQMVAVGKKFCRAREARCAGCPLQPLLPGGVPTAMA